MRAILNRISIRRVMTAHRPSQAPEVLVKLRHIAETLALRDRIRLVPREEDTLRDTLAETIDGACGRPARRAPSAPRWKTKWSRESYYITAVIMDSAVDLYDGPARALHDAYPGEDWDELRSFCIMPRGSAATATEPERHARRSRWRRLRTLRVAARAVYLRALDSLSEHLTQSVDEAPVDPALAPPDGAPGVNEVYRARLRAIADRLAPAGTAPATICWPTCAAGGQSARQPRRARRDRALRRLIEKVRLFGLHLVPLDVREDARLHRAALDEISALTGCATATRMLRKRSAGAAGA